MGGSARDYVLSMALPEAGPAFETARPFEFSDQREAVAVGAQLAEFTDAVPADMRGAIADSILLAQLAANKAAGEAQDVFRWYDKYVEVLQNIGWQIRDVDFQTQTVSDKNAGIHEAIIPVIVAMLGQQAAAASIVLAVLNGLKEMDASTPWITLFDRTSQHARGAKFQVSYVDADAQGQPEISLLSLGVPVNDSPGALFQFSTHDAELKKAAGKMGISMQRLNSARDAIAAPRQAHHCGVHKEYRDLMLHSGRGTQGSRFRVCSDGPRPAQRALFHGTFLASPSRRLF